MKRAVEKAHGTVGRRGPWQTLGEAVHRAQRATEDSNL
jgi:hypothetical protein